MKSKQGSQINLSIIVALMMIKISIWIIHHKEEESQRGGNLHKTVDKVRDYIRSLAKISF